DNELNSISLSVFLPSNLDDLSKNQWSKIETKIQRIVSKHGISGQGYSNEFLIYPEFEIYNEDTVTGMRTLISIEAEFSLFIQQYSTRKAYASYSKSVTGSGTTRQKALNNAISQISTSDPKLKTFIDSGKKKILSYYENNCDQLRNDADTYIKMKQYRKAIALYTMIPKEAKKCYTRIQKKSVEAYNAYQKQLCKENILAAKTKLADKDYKGVFNELLPLDPNSNCSTDINIIIDKVITKLSRGEQTILNNKRKNKNKRKQREANTKIILKFDSLRFGPKVKIRTRF
ncbi:MAG: hypothetical protein AAF617_14530, partial [Bacteroidota bacterium]